MEIRENQDFYCSKCKSWNNVRETKKITCDFVNKWGAEIPNCDLCLPCYKEQEKKKDDDNKYFSKLWVINSNQTI